VIGPEIQHGMEPLPRWRHTAGRLILRLIGWDVVTPPPKDPKMVMMAAPHTSNWDTFLMLVAASVYRVRIRFLVKDTLFWWPMGPLLRAFGGIPIDRSGNLGLVEQAAQVLREADRMMLAVAPSGTRTRTERWRSGFYWIAVQAQVPLVCGILDYGRKRASFGPRIEVTGDIRRDMDAIRAAYEGVTGKDPSKQTPIRVKEEDEPVPDAAPVPEAPPAAEA
jgi:1-acyl-sn-glycerol-3-phosphate acyltransferase